MKTLSIDVGIRNLACCLLEISSDKHWKIIDWFVLDLFEYTPPTSENLEEDLISVFKTYKKWKKDVLADFTKRNELEIKNNKRETHELAVKNYLLKKKLRMLT